MPLCWSTSNALEYIEWRTKYKKKTGKTAGRSTAIMELKLFAMIMREAVRLGHAGAKLGGTFRGNRFSDCAGGDFNMPIRKAAWRNQQNYLGRWRSDRKQAFCRVSQEECLSALIFSHRDGFA
jgi:hypothetical protein